MHIKSNRDIRTAKREINGRMFAAEMAPNYNQTISERLTIVDNVYKTYGEKLGKYMLGRDQKPDLIKLMQLRISYKKYSIKKAVAIRRVAYAAQSVEQSGTLLQAWGVWNEWARVHAYYCLQGGMPITIQNMAIKFGILAELASKQYEPIAPEKLNAAFEG